MCDEGPTDPTGSYGCKSDCSGTINYWSCSGGDETNVDICNPICGDGKMFSPWETCDDGSNDGNGCYVGCLGY